MDKESIIELQKIDCNCNDCKFMVRDIVHYNTVLAEDYNTQYTFFRSSKCRRLLKRREKLRKAKSVDEINKIKQAIRDIESLEFSYFPQKNNLNYGACEKLNIKVSFLPNTCQLETQNCFEHRKN